MPWKKLKKYVLVQPWCDLKIIIRHKSELNMLQQKDPEFFAYLQKNEPNLLNFEDSESENEQVTKNSEHAKQSKEKETKS